MAKIQAIHNTKAGTVKIETQEGIYTIGLNADFGLPYGITEANADTFKPIHHGTGLKLYNKIRKMMQGVEIKTI